jgi:hypothetical protein
MCLDKRDDKQDVDMQVLYAMQPLRETELRVRMG